MERWLANLHPGHPADLVEAMDCGEGFDCFGFNRVPGLLLNQLNRRNIQLRLEPVLFLLGWADGRQFDG